MLATQFELNLKNVLRTVAAEGSWKGMAPRKGRRRCTVMYSTVQYSMSKRCFAEAKRFAQGSLKQKNCGMSKNEDAPGPWKHVEGFAEGCFGS